MPKDTVAQIPPPKIRPTHADPAAFLQSKLNEVLQTYPIFSGLKDVVVQPEDGDGFVEYYSPLESRNPNPGKLTLGVRDLSERRATLHNMIAGDLLHYMGERDENGVPRNPGFYNLKKQFERTLTDDQHMINRFQYQRYKHDGKINPNLTYQDFLDMSGTDQYIRGFIFPDKNDEWRKPGKGEFTKEQRQLLSKIKDFVHGKQ